MQWINKFLKLNRLIKTDIHNCQNWSLNLHVLELNKQIILISIILFFFKDTKIIMKILK